MSAESAIRPECTEEHRKLSRVMWDQLVYLRTSLYLLRQIADFPLQRLASFDDQWFFTVVRRSLYETVVLAVTRLTTDGGSNVLTVKRCRDLVRSMLTPEAVNAFDEELRRTRFDKTRGELRKRVRDLRNARIAHLLLDDVRNGSALSLGFDDLEALVSEAEKLYRPLMFGATSSFLPISYDPAVRAANKPSETDIERILRLFAKDSYILNEPERNARWWSELRKRKSDDEINFINLWRKRIGLPEA